MPSFGLSFLSRESLRQARRFMNADQSGVRDEIGFLLVHQRYADRFFPGTSVLHTRLRYVLFIPWLYDDARRNRKRGMRAKDRIVAGELDLTSRLLGGDGVIGGRTYPKPSDQPPNFVYWTALQHWGLLREHPQGGQWSRAQVERLLDQPVAPNLRDEDEQPLADAAWPFAAPNPSDDWRSGQKLSFKLSQPEKTFLAVRLRSTISNGVEGKPSLLSLLVGRRLTADHAWSREICALARHERDALERAGQAAALAAIGRAIYAAQVETLKSKRDKRSCSDLHRSALANIVKDWGAQARELDWALFEDDMNGLPPLVGTALRATLEWVRCSSRDPMELEIPFRDAEEARKGRRARLSLTFGGVERRLEWKNDEHPVAEPLHYRWGNVRRLLKDLEGVR
jgi:hypothetical protein